MAPTSEIDSLGVLSAAETEQLLFTIQSSLSIRRRYQFTIWAQSRLAAMLPHDVLFCARHDPHKRALSGECYSNFPLPREMHERAFEPRGGLLARLLAAWEDADRAPFASHPGGAGPAAEALAEALAECGLADFVAHGMPAALGGVDTFFCFAQAREALVPAQIKREMKPVTARHSFLIELLLPYLHVTYQRIVAAERAREPVRNEPAPTDLPITGRETEILAWVREGKSNQEIGALLSISPLTVKNHVQKILRKLGASNRAQAVARAISLNLLPGNLAVDFERP
jgi:transcriptional regulator EpsA